MMYDIVYVLTKKARPKNQKKLNIVISQSFDFGKNFIFFWF